MEDISIMGRKTFFIAPVLSLIPEALLERLLSHGYEAYSIDDDGVCPMRKRVEDLISLYPGCILFFNIDACVEGIEWKEYIQTLCKKHQNDAKIGIIFAERISGEEKGRIENFYYHEANITASALALTSNSTENYETVLEALAFAEARGRRKMVRATCEPSCQVKFKNNTAHLYDVNRAYFCCTFDDLLQGVRMYDHFHDIEMDVNGMKFETDAVLIMKHSRNNINRYIFMFVKKDGSPELESHLKSRLNKKIYQIVTAERKAAMKKAFCSK